MSLSNNYQKLIPILTSSTSAIPQFTISSTSIGNYNCPDWKALNGTTTNGEDCWVSGSEGGWLTVTFDKPYTLAGLWFKQRIDPRISDVYFYTSKDGTNWDLQVSFNNKGIGWGEEAEFPFDDYVTCKYIKIGCDGTYVNIGAFNVFYVDMFFLIKMNNNFYSIKNKYYDIETKSYIPIEENNISTNYNDYCFGMPELFQTITINDETFKPIDKFDNFSLITDKNVNVDILGLKYNTELIVSLNDIDLSCAESIKAVKLETNKKQNVKIVISSDGGNTWNTYVDNEFKNIDKTIPLKPYELLTKEELVYWNDAANTIKDIGINVDEFNSNDFRKVLTNFKKIRLAYVINRETCEDSVEINKLSWQYDAKPTLQKMNDSEYIVNILGNSVKLTSLIDSELIKVSVMI